MEENNIYYYTNEHAQPQPVRVLLFQDSINIYDKQTEVYIRSIPLKNCSSVSEGTDYWVIDSSSDERLRLHKDELLSREISGKLQRISKGALYRLLTHRASIVICIFLTLLLALYALLIFSVPAVGSRLISRNAETEIGRKLQEMMLQQERLTGATVDTTRTRYLQDFADQLELSDHYPVRVTVLSSPTINAYALPGGEIVVYSGILEKMRSYPALVALLAHESTHINERHTLRSLLRKATTGMMVSLVFGDAAAVASVIAGNIEHLSSLRYSRSLETEADQLGMQLMLRNDVDPAGMLELMEILDSQAKVPEALEFLSTHPLTSVRRERADKFISVHPVKGTAREDLKAAFEKLTAASKKGPGNW